MKIKMSARNVDCWSGYSSIALTTHYFDEESGKWKIIGRYKLESMSKPLFSLRDAVQSAIADGNDEDRAWGNSFTGIVVTEDMAITELAILEAERKAKVESWFK